MQDLRPDRGLAPYLPAFLVRRVAARGTVRSAALEGHCLAATLFVDLAGFTQLTARTASRGPAGAEHLSEILNDYFGSMTGIIGAHGGEVVLFAGDAALALWPAASPETLASATMLATQCALSVREQLSGRSLEPQIVLRQRAAVGAGAVSLCEVGGIDGRWLPLVTGPAVLDLPNAIREARTDDVVLTPASWTLVADRCLGTPAREGCVCLSVVARPERLPPPMADLPYVSDAQLSPYVPEVLVSRIDAGHSAWIAEFRRVTVLFVRLIVPEAGGATLDRIQLATATLQRMLEQHEGTIYQVAVDDKGTVLIGVFGLPPQAQENDALRGVQAACSLQRILAESGLRTAVGVATGPGFCGTYGATWRRQYTVVGPVMNLAARLMQAADGNVFCDAATEERARASLQFESLAPLSLKGFEEPVPVFVPRGRRAEEQERRPLVGRIEEQRRLASMVEALAQGRGGVVVVTGAAGTGKSSLLRETVDRVAALPGLVLRGAAEAIERSTPYFAWREILRNLLGGPSAEIGLALGARLHARLEGDGTLLAWSSLLNVVLPLGLEDDEITSNMSGEARAKAVQQIVVRLLEKEAATRPIAIILDDLHWFDSSSIALARAVADSVPAVLIVSASRPTDNAVATPVGRLLDTPYAVRIVLEPLSSGAIETLVGRCMGVDRVDPAIVEFILERAEGNPFFSEELALAIRGSSLLGMGGAARALRRSDIQAVELPDSVHAAITSRVDRLTPHELLALKIASVIGRRFSYGMLQAVHPVEEDRGLLPDGMESLERLSLLRKQTDGVDPSYEFKHVIIQEAVYGLLPFAQRRQIHRRVATCYEDRPADSLSARYPLLAHHWEGAGDTRKAVFYLEKAASEAVRTFSSLEAEAFLLRAEELAANDPRLNHRDRVALREKLRGEARYQQADYDRAHAHYSRSLALRDVGLPRTKTGLAVDLAAQIGRQIAHRAWPSRFLGSPGDTGSERLEHAALVFNRFSSIAWYRGDQLALTHSIFTVLNYAEEAGDVSDTVHGSAAMAVLSGLVGWHTAARFYSERALRLADESRNPSDAARAHINTAIYAIGSGRWSEAHSHVEHALDLHRRLGDLQTWEASLALKGYLHAARGELSLAITCFDDVYRSAQKGLPQSRIWARNGHLAALVPRGDVRPAMLDELTSLAREFPDTAESITSYGLVAMAQLRLGLTSEALRSADRGLCLLLDRKPGAVYYAFWGLAALAETWLDLWRARPREASERDLRHKASQACDLLRTFSRMIVLARPRSALCDGRREAMSGNRKTALRRLAHGLQVAAELQMPFDEALLHAEIAHLLHPGDPALPRHEARTTMLLEGLGASAELTWIRARTSGLRGDDISQHAR